MEGRTRRDREADSPSSFGLAVADASCLIALNQLEHLGLLGTLFPSVVIPPAVAREIAPSVRRPAWITINPIDIRSTTALSDADLGPGETEAIALALVLDAAHILLDDRKARRAAMLHNLEVIGTVGILLSAKQRGLLPAVRPELDLLVRLGFRLAPAIVADALDRAGEQVEHWPAQP